MRKLFKVGSDRHDVGRVISSWHPDGNFLASAGRNSIVQITDRSGEVVDEIPMTQASTILSLAWDKDGDYLAVLQDNNSIVPLWSLNSRRVVPLESNLQDPTFLCWSKTGPQLAIGTAKGNLLIYNKQQKKKVPVVGKHAKRIVCGSWSMGGNRLVLGSEDKTITVSNEAGDTLIHTELKYAPVEASFCNRERRINPDGSDDTVSANLGGKSLLLLNIKDENEDPMELTFATTTPNGPCRYGDLVHYEWFNDDMLMVGFSGGWIIVVATSPNEIGEEKYAVQIHTSRLHTFSYNPVLRRVATGGNDGVRILDTKDFREVKSDHISTEDLENGKVSQVIWSPDGQILTVTTLNGNIYNFLAKMTILRATYKSTVGYLSSLREVSIFNARRKSRPVEVTLLLEPAVLAIGAKHVAAGMNNKAYYHRIASGLGTAKDVHEQEYVSTIRDIQLNHMYSAVLTDFKVILHPIEPSPSSSQQTKYFPQREEGSFSKVTCIALTDDFLYYGTEGGAVEVYCIAENVVLSSAELRLDAPIKSLYPNHSGTRVVVVDTANQVYLYNPVTGGGSNQSISRFEGTPQTISTVVWDATEKNAIMIFDGRYVHTYVYVPTSMKGSYISKLGPVEITLEGGVIMKPDKAELPSGNVLIMSVGGVLTCQTIGGNINTCNHPYFDQLVGDAVANSMDMTDSFPGHFKHAARSSNKDGGNPAYYKAKYCQSLALHKLEDAWQAAFKLDQRQYWLALSGKAMEMLNVELAIRVYRQLGDAGMVMALQQCRNIEDKHLLGGHIALLFCDYQRAQELFLLSSKPIAALNMQCDLMLWDQALRLAHTLALDRVPQISIKYGQQLEFRDNSEQALKLFESALNITDNEGVSLCPETLAPIAMMGIARCHLRMGNIRQGIRLASEVNSKALYAECGDILEQQKQYAEAASMHLKADNYEKAAEIFIRHILKNDKGRISEVSAILHKVDNSQLNSSFGKICIACSQYEEAVRAYERAKDIDKVVEIKLRHLDQIQEAFDIVRETSSSEGAQLVADYCMEVHDYRGAIEFMLMAKRSEEAFQLAQSHGQVDSYASLLGEHVGADDALKLAQYYEKTQEFGKAGRFYSMCQQYQRALKLFIQCGDREIDAAIDVVGKSQNEHLTHQLIDFLVGERDGIPKDPNYIYRLYMALKKYEDAAKTALIIARQEQDMGNYALAHSVVVETVRRLEDDEIRVPRQLRSQFVLLHSYILVKRLVKSGDHAGAARMLLRVAQNISKFPQHTVPILTSVVIECQRAGLKASSYEYAAMLMRPELRSGIDANLKRKIEAIVRRRSANNEDAPEDTSPCPVCGNAIPHSHLECPTTRDALPMCIVTGRHLVLNDWCFCPNTKFPALYSEYIRFVQGQLAKPGEESKTGEIIPPTAVDPLLGRPVTLQSIVKATPEEATKYIKTYNNVKDDEKDKKAKEDTEKGDKKNKKELNKTPSMADEYIFS